MIAIIDYDAGNLRSVEKAIETSGGETVVTNEANVIEAADKVVFPGVGVFGNAMENLHRLELVEPIKRVIASGKPFLGICVGLQLLHESSEESPGVQGLSVVKGEVKRFPHNMKVPHLGWNILDQVAENPLWKNVPQQSYFYFAHSFYTSPQDESIIVGRSDYAGAIPVAIRQKNLFGLQFHPEKSQKYGLQILKNFVELEERSC